MEDNKLQKLFDSIVSKTFFALLALVGTGITIYAFLQEKEVDLRYEIIANTNVLDFNADISKLEVTYDSTNLKETKENLRLYTIKVVNNGNKDILNEYYDDNEPLGISISSGKIIEKPEIIKTSSDYLSNNMKISNYLKGKSFFSRVILEPNEYFIVKLLVLHKVNQIPQIQALGKIAGQKTIEVINAIDTKNEQTFFVHVFSGNIWVQLLRLICYFFVVVLFILIIIAISEVINTYKEKKSRENLINDFKNLKIYEYNRMDDAIFDRYQKDGSWLLDSMQSLLEDEDELNKNYKEILKALKSKDYRRSSRVESEYSQLLLEKDEWATISQMINDGIVIKDNNKLTINQAMYATLNQFIEFLDEKGVIKKKNIHSSSIVVHRN